MGDIISRFEKRGFKLVAMKFVAPGRDRFIEHYKHRNSFGTDEFYQMIDYMVSAPVLAMVWEGENVILDGRKMIGVTNPHESQPGTIRGDFSTDITRNVIHGSDLVEAAEEEIALWFSPEELIDWDLHSSAWIFS
jgi:nucleoside-diphosphate kinase